jgi:hypothetical protein
VPSRTTRRLVLLAAVLGMLAAPARGDTTHYLFSYFTGNGEDGLHLAHSTDGWRWTPVNGGRSLLAPTVGSRLMRDPSIVRGPDGVFHMVWTTGWWDAGIGVAHSRDLVSWSPQQWLPVMAHEPTALNAWAPEIFYDQAAGHYLIFWASTIPGRFPETEPGGDRDGDRRLNHRIYAVTTRDFLTYSPTRLFYDGGFNVIDATLIRHDGEYVLIVKDETKEPPKKHLRIARAPRAEGPYGAASAPFSVDWVEGPTALKVGNRWVVYYDEYTRKRYGAVASEDLRTWTVVSDRLQFPADARHGTAFAVDERVVGFLARGR